MVYSVILMSAVVVVFNLPVLFYMIEIISGQELEWWFDQDQ